MVQKREWQDAEMMALAKHRLDHLNYRAGKLVETGAFDLAELGASSYAAGVRMLLFHAINTLADLGGPELRSDLERIKAYCDEIDNPKTAA
jgi:hypothetical protein